MKTFLFIVISLLVTVTTFGQKKSAGYPTAVLSEANLGAVMSISPYSSALGFDSRYEGVKGSPRLLDTLAQSLVLLKGQEKYYRMNIDIDLVRNAILFAGFSGGDMMEILSNYVKEVIINYRGKEMVFRTTESLSFDRKPEGNKFYMVLKPGKMEFIKIPDRNFKEADYQRAYSPDIRYDEFTDASKYFIMSEDSVYHRVMLTRKSLSKLFPGKKQMINEQFNEKVSVDPESDVIYLLERL